MHVPLLALPPLWHDVSTFDSHYCGMAGAGPISDCVWLDAVLFTAAFIGIFVLAANLVPLFQRKTPFDPWLRYELQSRVPSMVFGFICWYFWLELVCFSGDVLFWFNWNNLFTATLQVFGPIAIGYWLSDCILLAFAMKTFPACPQSLQNMEASGAPRAWDGMPELIDFVPNVFNILLVVVVTSMKKGGTFAVFLLMAQSTLFLASLKELLALYWWAKASSDANYAMMQADAELNPATSSSSEQRSSDIKFKSLALQPYSTIRHIKPKTVTYRVLNVVSEYTLAGYKFFSGPFSLLRLWHIRHMFPTEFCVLLIVLTLRESVSFLLAVLKALSTMFPTQFAFLRADGKHHQQ